MARPRQFAARSFRTKRLTDWGFGVDMLAQNLTSSAKLLGTTSLTIAEQATLVRIRGLIHFLLVSAGSVGDGFLGAAGIALVNSDAFAQGINSIPGPQSDANWDSWIWHSFFDARAVTATITDGANAAGISQRIEIDSKAMRKWDPAETLVLMVEGTETGVANLQINCDTRLLLKSA